MTAIATTTQSQHPGYKECLAFADLLSRTWLETQPAADQPRRVRAAIIETDKRECIQQVLLTMGVHSNDHHSTELGQTLRASDKNSSSATRLITTLWHIQLSTGPSCFVSPLYATELAFPPSSKAGMVGAVFNANAMPDYNVTRLIQALEELGISHESLTSAIFNMNGDRTPKPIILAARNNQEDVALLRFIQLGGAIQLLQLLGTSEYGTRQQNLVFFPPKPLSQLQKLAIIKLFDYCGIDRNSYSFVDIQGAQCLELRTEATINIVLELKTFANPNPLTLAKPEMG
ncbi:MAG: hypothetical protein JNK24_07315 [Alphaproteobacteria bacterium]|nr:hypothetical protein [Alphaproteobacteria bacterium]